MKNACLRWGKIDEARVENGWLLVLFHRVFAWPRTARAIAENKGAADYRDALAALGDRSRLVSWMDSFGMEQALKLTGKSFKKHVPKASGTDATTYAKVANAASKHTDPDTAIQIAKTAAKQDKRTHDVMKQGYEKL